MPPHEDVSQPSPEITQTAPVVYAVPSIAPYGGGGGNIVVNAPIVIEPEPVPAPIVVPDTTSPVITIIGDNPANVTAGDVYTDAGATANDDKDNDVTSSIVKGGTFVDTSTAGSYTIIYSATDSSGNIGTATRTVNVVPPPLVTTTIDTDTTLAPGEYNYDNLVITNGATLTLSGDPTSSNSFKGVKITAINLTIDSGSSISADSKGYGAWQGPGASSNFSIGASYGGFSYSGATFSSMYGSATKPIDLGSGGFGNGGGAIRIVVSDTFTDNGTVSANGGIASSGGSIYVTAKK